MFILTTTMASHSLYWIYSLLFLVAYTLWQPFVAYFRSDIDIIVFLPRREPKGGRSGRWETHKKYGHPKENNDQIILLRALYQTYYFFYIFSCVLMINQQIKWKPQTLFLVWQTYSFISHLWCLYMQKKFKNKFGYNIELLIYQSIYSDTLNFDIP